MTHFAYFDCHSGISGDMTLAALIDLGVEPQAIESAVRSMGLPDLSLHCGDVKKCGFRAASVQIEHPPEHAHRHLHHIQEMIEGAEEISAEAKQLAMRIFGHVAVAEAQVHGTTLEKVHFHEVGAIDSIADIVGVSVALCSLGITSAMASPIPTGSGAITIDHGRVSVPAPATAEILRDVPLADSPIKRELTTPTGAAIIKELCTEFGSLPAMTIDRIGYGAGTMDLPGQPNLLRILLGQRRSNATDSAAVLGHPETQHDRVVVLETNLDDATGEQIADCADRLLQAGALDVTQTFCVMKKGRNGVVLSVIAPPERVPPLEELIFRHTTTLGVRRYWADRDILPRQAIRVTTPLGSLHAKTATLPGGGTRTKVESEDARRLATEHALSVQEVDRIAHRSLSE